MQPDPSELVSIAQAAALIPSPRAGCRTALSTVYRLIERHKLPSWKRGAWRYVRRADIVALFEAVPRFDPPPKPKSAAIRARDEWTQKILREAGLA
jgi:hypothetical protein